MLTVEVQLLCTFVGFEAHSKLNKVRSNVRHDGLETGPCPKQPDHVSILTLPIDTAYTYSWMTAVWQGNDSGLIFQITVFQHKENYTNPLLGNVGHMEKLYTRMTFFLHKEITLIHCHSAVCIFSVKRVALDIKCEKIARQGYIKSETLGETIK